MKKEARTLSRMADRLQVLEVGEGYAAMMKSPLKRKYDALKQQYQTKYGTPFQYQK